MRYRAVDLMIQWLRVRPALRETLVQVAAKDSEPQVRDRAQAALVETYHARVTESVVALAGDGSANGITARCKARHGAVTSERRLSPVRLGLAAACRVPRPFLQLRECRSRRAMRRRRNISPRAERFLSRGK